MRKPSCKKPNYAHTVYACFIGFVVQSITVNFAPLLFLTFQASYGISLDKIALLTTINFGLQLLTDLLSAKFADRVGYRACAVIAHVLSAAGLAGLAVLPGLFPSPYAGIACAVGVYAVGSGLLEVLLSPIMEACPGGAKESAMSLLHSFYCWGHVCVVLLSCLFFAAFGVERWRYLALAWALVPLVNLIAFAKVPIAPLLREGDVAIGGGRLFRMKEFWALLLVMACAGASEQSVAQWASAYAESGLNMPKAVGDLAGPLSFAAMMGVSRVLFGKLGNGASLEKFMLGSCALCLFSYLLISLSPVPALGFLGCALCGLAVGVAWPGTISVAARKIRGGGTSMFAFLALAGDLGCGGGPTLVGFVSDRFGGQLRAGILAAAAFPALLFVGLLLSGRMAGKAGAAKTKGV
ncbi:MAG: MFS transporter [Clostridiales bacterium]|jgi:fucose permease|nr:MFS transporter [Clostridiales bacterium]